MEKYQEPKLGDKNWNPQTGEIFTLTDKGWESSGNAFSSKRLPNELGATEKLGRGMMDIAQGIKQGYLWATDENKFKDYTKQVDSEIDLYDKGRRLQGEDGVDWWRLGGQAVATLPVGMGKTAATLGGQAVKSGIQGATAASSIYTKGGDLKDKATQTVFGGAGGAVAPVALNALGKIAGGAINKTKNTFNSGKAAIPGISGKVQVELANQGVDFTSLPTTMKRNLVVAAKEQIKVDGKLDADALVRKVNAEELGFVGDKAATASQLTRNPKLWAKERNLSKLNEVGDDLSARYSTQDARFAELGDEMIAGSKGTAKDIGDTNESIVRAIRGKWKDSQKEVSRVYGDITKKYGNIETDLSGIGKFLDENDWDKTAEPVVESVQKLLKKNGLINDDGFTGKLLPLKQVESIRKAINKKFVNSKDPNISRLGSEVIDALDESAIDSVGDDMFSQARQAASTRFKDFESKVGSTLKKITGETLSEDDAFNSVRKAKLEELQAIKDNLTGKNIPDKTGEGMGAWNNVRQQTLRHLWDKSTKESQGFSGGAFKKELDAIGRKKLNVLFDKVEVDKLYKVAKAGVDLTATPARSPVNFSNTTPTAFNYLDDSGMLGALKNMSKKGALKADADFYLSGSPTNKPIAGEGINKGIESILKGNPSYNGATMPSVSLMSGVGLPVGLLGAGYGKDKAEGLLSLFK